MEGSLRHISTIIAALLAFAAIGPVAFDFSRYLYLRPEFASPPAILSVKTRLSVSSSAQVGAARAGVSTGDLHVL
jgi:hypothetical protein